MHARGVPDPGSQNEEVIDLQAMLADLELLVNTESPSLDVPLLTASAITLASVVARRLGSAPAIIDGPAGPHVHWSGGGTPKVLIVGHHDTVFPVGSCAARPFAVVDGRAMGPGVFDMKAGIVQALHAVASLADRSGVELLITSDEEVGSLTSRDLIEARAIACGSVLVCEPSADGGAVKIARKGTGTFEVVVHGKASHAGLEPEKGVNALVAAAELITTAVAETGVQATVTHTVITSQDQARRRGFAGSPTILVNGSDPFEDPAAPAAMACRLYPTPEGLRGVPALRDLRRALKRVAEG